MDPGPGSRPPNLTDMATRGDIASERVRKHQARADLLGRDEHPGGVVLGIRSRLGRLLRRVRGR